MAHTSRAELADLAARCHGGQDDHPVRTAEWESAVAGLVGVPHAAAVSSGRRGMLLILKHLGIGIDDEVIVPAYTLKDLIPLIRSLGAKAVPADIDAETLNVSPKAISARITARTKAILALHAFGLPCDIESIASLALRHGLALIEDCAHSLGATVKGRPTGSFGHAGFFSFETTKPVNTFGGGMIVSSDLRLVENVRLDTAGDVVDVDPLRKKIRATRTERLLFSTRAAFAPLYVLANPQWNRLGGRLYRRFQRPPPASIRYLSVQAEIGLKKLATLPARIAERKAKAEMLRSLLVPDIRPQRVDEGHESSWYFLVVVLPREASEVRRRMLFRGIDAGIGDEIADNCARLLGYSDCPSVDEVHDRAISLPLYEGISEEAIRKVARVLNGIVS